MDVFEAIKKRRSIRSFLDDPVPDEDINRIIDAATWAPSGSDSQPWEFLIVKDDKKKKELAKVVKSKMDGIIKEEIKDDKEKQLLRSYAKYFTFFYRAPIVIIVYGQEENAGFREIINKYRSKDQAIKSTSFVQSMSAAVENLILAAESLGYGTCWMTGPLIAKNELKKAVNMELSKSIIAIIPLGKPKVIPEAPKRKKKEDTVKYI